MKKLSFILFAVSFMIIFTGCASKTTQTGTQPVTKNGNGTVAINKAPAEPVLVPCVATLSTPIEKAPGLPTTMDTYQLDQWRNNSTRIKTATRTFSLADFADSKANPVNPRNPVEKTTLKEDLFFEGEKTDPKSGLEFSAAIQICDKNNMTTQSNDFEKVPSTASTKDSLGFNESLQDFNRITNGLPTEPGDYRIDGFTYVNGKWALTNRIDKITFTK